ncbi:MAG TPA: flavin reductase family protein [Candidatus Pacearchaeota archaeon]|nr:flavin reductase family protein [Candidatus Pacearchaeota archaeon]
MRISEQIWPRAVCLVTTASKKGKVNVMTASFVMPISFEPKYLAFSIAPERESFKNLKETKEFGLNVCDEKMYRKALICGSYSGKNTDKFKLAKLEKENAKFIKAPLLKESPISFECKVEAIKRFGDHYLVVGKVINEVVRKENFKPLLHKTKNVFPKIK